MEDYHIYSYNVEITGEAQLLKHDHCGTINSTQDEAVKDYFDGKLYHTFNNSKYFSNEDLYIYAIIPYKQTKPTKHLLRGRRGLYRFYSAIAASIPPLVAKDIFEQRLDSFMKRFGIHIAPPQKAFIKTVGGNGCKACGHPGNFIRMALMCPQHGLIGGL